MNKPQAWVLTDWFVCELAPLWVTRLGLDEGPALPAELPEVQSSADIRGARRHIT